MCVVTWGLNATDLQMYIQIKAVDEMYCTWPPGGCTSSHLVHQQNWCSSLKLVPTFLKCHIVCFSCILKVPRLWRHSTCSCSSPAALCLTAVSHRTVFVLHSHKPQWLYLSWWAATAKCRSLHLKRIVCVDFLKYFIHLKKKFMCKRFVHHSNEFIIYYCVIFVVFCDVPDVISSWQSVLVPSGRSSFLWYFLILITY